MKWLQKEPVLFGAFVTAVADLVVLLSPVGEETKVAVGVVVTAGVAWVVRMLSTPVQQAEAQRVEAAAQASEVTEQRIGAFLAGVDAAPKPAKPTRRQQALG